MIALENVSKKFLSKKVLQSIDCTIPSGQKVLLSGPNGAGKTTLLKMIAGMVKPTTGSITYDSMNIWDDIRSFRGRLGLVLDESFLYADLSLWDNLIFYARLYRVRNADEKINAWAETFALKNHLHVEVRSFSKGERQKASLIRALMHEPPMLILDEPMSGLDTVSKAKLLEILGTTNSTIVFSAHEDLSKETWIHRNFSLSGGTLVERHA